MYRYDSNISFILSSEDLMDIALAVMFHSSGFLEICLVLSILLSIFWF